MGQTVARMLVDRLWGDRSKNVKKVNVLKIFDVDV